MRLAVATLLALASYVSANGISLAIGQVTGFGAPSSMIEAAPISVRNQCSGRGSFFVPFLEKALCCTAETFVP